MRALLAVALLAGLAPTAGPGPHDFPPFVMTIEVWRAAAVGLADGRRIAGMETYRLEYRYGDDWTQTMTSASLAAAIDPRTETMISARVGSTAECRQGDYRSFDALTKWRTVGREPGMCNGVGRWIHYGIAWSSHWAERGWTRHEGPARGQVTYEHQGERVTFDLHTGLPVLYEAGLNRGAVGERELYRLEHWGR